MSPVWQCANLVSWQSDARSPSLAGRGVASKSVSRFVSAVLLLHVFNVRGCLRNKVQKIQIDFHSEQLQPCTAGKIFSMKVWTHTKKTFKMKQALNRNDFRFIAKDRVLRSFHLFFLKVSITPSFNTLHCLSNWTLLTGLVNGRVGTMRKFVIFLDQRINNIFFKKSTIFKRFTTKLPQFLKLF